LDTYAGQAALPISQPKYAHPGHWIKVRTFGKRGKNEASENGVSLKSKDTNTSPARQLSAKRARADAGAEKELEPCAGDHSLVKRLEYIRERPVALRDAAASGRRKALACATAVVACHGPHRNSSDVAVCVRKVQ
jgi:hypothetical protein